MTISHQTQAILLLTAYLGKVVKDDPRPLTPSEWGRFAQWLRENEIQPEDLLSHSPASLLSNWNDRTITLERIQYLLNRSAALGLAMEKWERAGLWVMPRSDANYPVRLKKLLKSGSPAILFGCGNQSLLSHGGLAVVGSRDATVEDLVFTTRLGCDAARQDLSIISGGARGVDEAAMVGALEHGGQVVGVLADSLLRTATSAKYRDGLMSGNVVLISPFNPEAGFDTGNAMSRNKYIYCLADGAIVIATTKGKGGTWNGALENLKARWVPMWVKRHQDICSGNAALVQQGAQWLPENNRELSTLFSGGADLQTVAPVPDLFSVPVAPINELSDVSAPTNNTKVNASGRAESSASADVPAVIPSARSGEPVKRLLDYETSVQRTQEDVQRTPAFEQPDTTLNERHETPTSLANLTFYDLFLRRLEQLTSNGAVTPEKLGEELDLHKVQLTTWLNRAIAEGYVDKFAKPVRYQWISFQPQQPSLLDMAQSGNSITDEMVTQGESQ
ncbi:MAG: DNA-processing protein DprA [Chloroflexota bacterium]|nr:DNA-processing protein DprA [Chloroflexota bacterium]